MKKLEYEYIEHFGNEGQFRIAVTSIEVQIMRKWKGRNTKN